MQVMIECILVPQNPNIQPPAVTGLFEPADDNTDPFAFVEFTNDLRDELAKSINVTREDLLDEATFFRINIR